MASFASRGQIPPEEKEAKAIERRRALEEERKKRIFNARVRTTGKDVDALKAQMDEKEAQRKAELDEEAAWQRQLEHNEKFMARREAQINLQRKKLEDETRAYNLQLSQAKAEEKQREAEMEVQMEQLQITSGSVSGGTAFDGEDPEFETRQKAQAAQLKEWADQVAAEKLLLQRQEEEEQARYEEQQRQLERRRAQMEAERTRAQLELSAQTREYNLWLAEQKKLREQQEREEEEARAQAQLEEAQRSALLTESTQQSALGEGRVVPYDYKGMTVDQIAAIREENLRLMEEKEAQRKAEEEEERRWLEQSMHFNGLVTKSVATQNLRRKQNVREVNETNQRLAQQHYDRQNYEANVLYKNEIDSSFYDKFNTTTR